MSKTWFITGTSKGFGRIWAEAALDRGDRVVATARKIESLAGLTEKYGDSVLPLALDVTDKAAVDAAVKRGHDHFGALDVVVNNAGYGLFGMVEEVSEQQARAQLETNFFGALWVTQAALPYLRQQRSGLIIQVSSIGGVNAFPSIGLYHASKWALEGMSQALAGEVKDFGIKVTIVEPTGYSTDWSGPSAVNAEPNAAYDEARVKINELTRARRTKRGNPEATGPVILEIVDMAEPPLRVFFGTGPNAMIHEEYARRLAEWDTYEALSDAAYGS